MAYDKESDPDTTAGALRRDKKSQRKKKYLLQEKLEKNEQEKQVKDQLQNSRNIVVFTGRALQEIMRDQTMIKSFVTLAYISNIMVGSEITPLQKQHLLKMVR
jgi:ribosomal protein S4